MAEEHERYYQHFKWFCGSPERLETFIRAHGTLEDCERVLVAVQALIQREERRAWVASALWTFSKVTAAVAGTMTAIGVIWAIIQKLPVLFGP